MVASDLRPSGAADLAGWLADSARHRPDGTPVLQWLEERRRTTPYRVKHVPLAAMRGRRVAGGGNLVHQTGRFPTVERLRVRAEHGAVPEWWQPVGTNCHVDIEARSLLLALHAMVSPS